MNHDTPALCYDRWHEQDTQTNANAVIRTAQAWLALGRRDRQGQRHCRRRRRGRHAADGRSALCYGGGIHRQDPKRLDKVITRFIDGIKRPFYLTVIDSRGTASVTRYGDDGSIARICAGPAQALGWNWFRRLL